MAGQKQKQGFLKVTQIKSTIGRVEKQKRTAKALGLGRVNASRILPDNPAVRGMVASIGHLVRVEEAEIASSPKKQAPRLPAGKAGNDAKDKNETA